MSSLWARFWVIKLLELVVRCTIEKNEHLDGNQAYHFGCLSGTHDKFISTVLLYFVDKICSMTFTQYISQWHTLGRDYLKTRTGLYLTER